MEHNTIFSIPAKVVTDRVSDKSKGFGFVTFASEDEAHTALTEMNGKVCTSLYFITLNLRNLSLMVICCSL